MKVKTAKTYIAQITKLRENAAEYVELHDGEDTDFIVDMSTVLDNYKKQLEQAIEEADIGIG